MFTWMSAKKRISVACDNYGITQRQHCNNDNVMHASMWFEFFGGLLYVKTCDIWEENMITRSED